MFDVDDLAYAYGKPESTAQFKHVAEDFVVEEKLTFTPDGEGAHCYLFLEKTHANTDWVARQLARQLGLKPVQVGYAGRKDRLAVTRQWFSLEWNQTELPLASDLEIEGVKALQVTRHHRKLRPGAVRANRFTIRLRHVSDSQALEARLLRVQSGGVPNYFGPQRFGRHGANLDLAQRLFAKQRVRDRNRRSMALSAARSWLFNQVCSQRVRDKTWQTILPGEVCQAEGRRARFLCEQLDDEIMARAKACEIHATGTLVGRADLEPTAQAGDTEAHALAPWQSWCEGLIELGLKSDRRPLRVCPQDMTWQWHDQDLIVGFGLPAGAFATAVLRELVCLSPSD